MRKERFVKGNSKYCRDLKDFYQFSVVTKAFSIDLLVF
jgi:hypothetical protein